MKVHIITLGCAKNVVDSEKLMAQLEVNDVDLAPALEEADIALINTCGFIDAAKEESISAILETARRKGKGRLKKVYAFGCLSQRYMLDLTGDIPEVDRFFGVNSTEELLRELGLEYRMELLGERHLTTPSHFAYLKISEGCDNPCSFCAIPLMRGGHKSRSMEDIVLEAERLAMRGVRELVVIAQDTSFYGLDLYGRRRLADLLSRLEAIDGVEWVRLMYAYPAKFPMDVLDVMARSAGICPYLDIPVQHTSDSILKSMRRGVSSQAQRDLLRSMRERVPGIALRTTLIVGYPGETAREFDELLRFVEEMKFERLGVFTYSQEEGTAAHPLGDPVPLSEKEHRRSLLMELQQGLSQELNNSLIGTRQRVLIDRQEGGRYFGRTAWDAPEIDNEVIVSSSGPLTLGGFYQIDIIDAYEYDLVGTVGSMIPGREQIV